MPRLTAVNSSIAAGASWRPLQGWQYEYLPWRARIEVMVNAVAVGAVVQANTGSEAIQPESPVTAGGTLGVLPAPLNNYPLVFLAPAGDRLDIAVRNTTGGAIAGINMLVDVNPA